MVAETSFSFQINYIAVLAESGQGGEKTAELCLFILLIQSTALTIISQEHGRSKKNQWFVPFHYSGVTDTLVNSNYSVQTNKNSSRELEELLSKLR